MAETFAGVRSHLKVAEANNSVLHSAEDPEWSNYVAGNKTPNLQGHGYNMKKTLRHFAVKGSDFFTQAPFNTG